MSNKGFTLIELMIVIAIIAILAAVALPNFIGARERAKKTKCIAAMDTLRKAMDMYAPGNMSSPESYPAELDGGGYHASSFAIDSKLAGSLARYIQVTQTFQNCTAVTFNSVISGSYTVFAVAKDKFQTKLTVTDETVSIP